ncbi:Uncharacterized protein dnl_29240 [Desulfonema limicola]|uniref:Type II secretion system protein GspC N-terminal domain-containing protein n=1 Tax=Desulfonema limicola TaxID=45656 RepID=A0A975B7Z0_9BACT|nr:hypothetical protein [Desulfonema limicola]QTA80614.1 Uncharacterized protein dnl_29240 [Desulfonema limicola]
MVSKIWLINVILTFIAVFLCIRIYVLWTDKVFTRSEIPVNNGFEESSDIVRPGIEKTLSESAYKVIVDRNLFSPDREEFIPDETQPEPEQINISGRKISLYGVIIMDDYKKALIDNPVREPGDRPEKWVQVGDIVGELTVAAINSESILLNEGSKKYEISLYDKEKKRLRSAPAPVEERSSAPNVVSAGSEKPRQKPSDTSNKEKISEDEYEIVKTPFGDIKRRKK